VRQKVVGADAASGCFGAAQGGGHAIIVACLQQAGNIGRAGQHGRYACQTIAAARIADPGPISFQPPLLTRHPGLDPGRRRSAASPALSYNPANGLHV
jgi:hypothetical protein